MTVEIQEGNLLFSFEFDAIKFDNTEYYRQHFGKIHVRACRKKRTPCDRITLKGVPAVDILAVNADTGYLIEIRDYTNPDTVDKNLDDLIEEFLGKVLLTLSAILPMKINANSSEKEIANLFSNVSHIDVILHLELPSLPSSLQQASWSRSTIQMKLKNKLKENVNPKVVSKIHLQNLPWIVSQSTQ